jgi:CelD/BcsL family acetyltransferase involved in cellulose biosynthesis
MTNVSATGESGWSVDQLGEDAFSSMGSEWRDLLERSGADQMFLGTAWLGSWWDSWGKQQPAADIVLLAVRDESGRLMGLAPLYSTTEKFLSLLRIRRMQFLGTNFRRAGITRTEYVDFIVDNDHKDTALRLLLDHIFNKIDFDEFVIVDNRLDSPSRELLLRTAAESSCLIRHTDEDAGTRISLEQDFETYLASLGKNTRLRLFNRRKVLQSLGELNVKVFSHTEFDDGFRILSELFSKRWGQPIFTAEQERFQRQLLDQLHDSCSPQMSGIFLDGECISVLYDIRVANTQYNFLSGFSTDVHPKISLGMLHFGYAIEQAYKDGVEYYDLLLGQGQRTAYKQNFAGEEVFADTIQIVRHPLMKLVHRAHNALSG